MMIKTSNDAKALVSYKNVEMKKLLDLKSKTFLKCLGLKESFELLKAAVNIAYPNMEGLGDW